MAWNILKRLRRRRVPAKTSGRRPRLELLEERWVLAVLDTANFTENPFASSSNLSSATGLAWAPDGSGRLFVIRKAGEVRVIQHNNNNPATGTLQATPWTTVTPVFTNSECGLIGICFDRDFINNRYVYLFVTVSSSEQQIIRYTDSGGVGTNKTTLIAGLPTVGANHDGGGIGIGPDNKLYWSIGDLGNSTGVDANLTSLASKVGRANLDGTPVSDNPYNDNDGVTEPADYIWARGFRNPFTMSIRELPGEAIPGQVWVDVAGTGYEQIFQVNASDHAGYNDFENNQPVTTPPNGGQYIQPKIKWRTNSTDTRTIAAGGAVRNNNVVTFTTTAAHGFRQGERIVISGVTDTSFNGTFYVLSASNAPGTTTFTVAQNGPNATSGSGSAQTQNLGGAATGGTFYNGSDFAPEYRGNYFFGDFNSGRLNRATLSGSNVTSVDYFVNSVPGAVDADTGPDGALYYVGVNSNVVYRLRYNHGAQQSIIVSALNMNLVEGGSGVFGVRLAVAPVSNVTINVARTSGDSELGIASGSTLTFTPTNWFVPQNVSLAAAEDADSSNDTATFSLASAGLTNQDVTVGAIDNDAQGIVLSTTTLNINEGNNNTFTVALEKPPTGTVTVNVARTSGDTDISVSCGSTLNFNSANYNIPQTVTIAAAEDADNLNDTATVSVSAPSATTRTVSVTGIDNDALAPNITTTADTTAVVNAPHSYDVDATGSPTPSYVLDVFPSGMSIHSTTGVISWTPTATGNFNVTVRAQNGVAPDATQSFTIVVSPDAPPTAVLTQPTAGATISGTTAEFYGDGFDDVGTVRAEFYVDGILRYTDINTGGHYHFRGTHLLFDTTQYSNGPHTLRMTVFDTAGQSGSAEVNVTISNPVANSFQVTSLTPTPTGFVAQFNRDLDISTLNLYDQEGVLNAADVTLSGNSAGEVRGSLLVDAGLRKITFLKTGGLLAADTYTVSLISGANAFKDTLGNLLDGNANGTAGDNYLGNFTIGVQPGNAVTLSIPDFTRGYGQAVSVPASGTGLPIAISNAQGVKSASFTLNYNPALLTITGGAVGAGITGNVTIDTSAPGVAQISVASSTELSSTAGLKTLVSLTASVPSNALYSQKQLLDLSHVHLLDTSPVPVALPAVDDDGIHVAAYFGDTNGDQSYNAPDATETQRLIVGIDTGFDSYQLADPYLVVDITGNGQMQADDVTQIQRAIVGLSTPNIPPHPGLSPPAIGGPDPIISIPQNLTASVGETITVPVELFVTEATGIELAGADIAIAYEASTLELTDADVGQLLVGFGLSINTTSPGIVRLSLTGFPLDLPFGASGVLATLQFTVIAGAGTTSRINLLQSSAAQHTALYDAAGRALTLSPAPTNGDDDEVDGLISILGSDQPVPARSQAAVDSVFDGDDDFTPELLEDCVALI